MDGTNLASVYVEVGADLSDLNAQLQGAVKEASDAGQEIGQELASGVAASGGLEEIAHDIQAIGPQLSELGTGFAELGKGMLVGGAAMTEISEGIASVAEEAISFTGKIQFSTAALTTFFGSGEKAAQVLEEIKGIEQSSIFSFPQLAGAAQQLAAMGVAAEKIPETLKAIALSAEAIGGSAASLDSATMAISRIQATGQLSQRALVQLGLSWSDLAKTMGTTATVAKEQLTKGLEDADAVLDIVTKSIQAKMKGLADSTATTIPVALNQLKAAWDEVLGKLGPVLAPVLSQVASGIKAVLEAITPLIQDFAALPTPVKDLAIGLGLLFVAIGPITVALGALVFASGEILESLPKMVEAWGALRQIMVATEVSQAGAAMTETATAVTATGTAAAEAAPAMAGLAAAASTAALAFGGLIALGVGAAIGAWLGHIQAVQDAFDKLFEATGITNLINRFEGANGASEDFLKSTLALETALSKQGITVDGTGLSIEQYAAKLRDAAKAQSQMNAEVDNGGPWDHLSKNAQNIVSTVQGLQVNLQKAKEAVIELTNAGAGTDVIVAAQNKVKDALAALGDTSAKVAKQMEELAITEQKEFQETYDLIGKQPQISGDPFDAVIANIKAYEKELSDSGQLTAENMAIIQSKVDAATANYTADMKTIQDATAKGFKFDQDIAQIQKLIEKLQDSKNASSQFTQNLIADLQQLEGALRNGQQEYTLYANSVTYAAGETQRLINVDQALATAHSGLIGTIQNGVAVMGSTAKIFDMATSSGDGVVQMIVVHMGPAFVTLADAAAKAGMSIQDFTAKTQEAALDARAAMGDIGAASDSLVLKIKTGEGDAIKTLQAALGAYSQLRDEVNNGTASQAELAKAVQMVQSAASAANIGLANVGSTMALTADEQQKLNQALLAGGNAFHDIGVAASGAASDMDAYFNAVDKASSLGMPPLDGSGFNVPVGSGQKVVQSFGAGGNVGGGISQTINVVTPSTFTGRAPGATMAETNIMDATGQTLNEVRAAQQAADAAAKKAAADKAAADAAAAATVKTANLKGELDYLQAQMQKGGDRAKVLAQQMEGLSRAGLDNTQAYQDMADELDGIYTLNGQLNDQYSSIQEQLGMTVTGFDSLSVSMGAVTDVLTQASAAAATFTKTAMNPTGTVTPGTSGTLPPINTGPEAGWTKLGPGPTVGVSPATQGLVPVGTTVNLVMDGAIISSQSAADELLSTAVDILKRDVGVKL